MGRLGRRGGLGTPLKGLHVEETGVTKRDLERLPDCFLLAISL